MSNTTYCIFWKQHFSKKVKKLGKHGWGKSDSLVLDFSAGIIASTFYFSPTTRPGPTSLSCTEKDPCSRCDRGTHKELTLWNWGTWNLLTQASLWPSPGCALSVKTGELVRRLMIWCRQRSRWDKSELSPKLWECGPIKEMGETGDDDLSGEVELTGEVMDICLGDV